MGQLCEWIERLLYPDNGRDSISESGKGIWIRINGKSCKDGICKFNMPLSTMIPYDTGDLYKFIMVLVGSKGNRVLVKHVRYQMMKGVHRSAQFGKKNAKGERMFKSNRTYGTSSGDGGGANSSGGRRRGTKQYFCKICKSNRDIERDGRGNAYCVDCGTKMFS